MNIANKLTLSRIVMIPFILFFLLPLPYCEACAFSGFIVSTPGRVIAFMLFILAAMTDLLDGMLARKQGIVSNFGKLVDPIADKLLVLSVFTAFVQLNRISTYVIVLIAAREFIVTGIRMVAVEHGLVIAASWFGKVKTVFQIITLCTLMFEPIIVQWIDPTQSFLGYGTPWTIPGDILVAVTLLLTVFSGLDYWLKNRALLSDALKV
ncbi:MAG: CDP-diacylglycerol--glycerol-3-phosphate 3-phosphatidyltransferase [Clostridiales bacterium]|jgi:CDP-diacylglycerol--glycerol-3-phosphate 3-phosphatidyltransferase|nr:CDP-diacylglycerol--glycerol-3-phosphate 3-phosphatidyltransferase [Clostridiales bacterium]MDD2571678.1 CDP-diacylglycerol--glycerol-3-phosphate 3-phosphatidyltransferase [Eubacteriales bacterium]MDY0119861.1 CDP-diacylglycerol--glycerol-3-phosphate 3-phosphatidyltransferase [Clostridia bacterium]MCK9349657.1 CDP-diacylglycerol--glycerol-3-phosphate 3-phosphatidyltransferase [Clostridiales bacterium]MDD3418600.1 CDP-diacylglycerol--glycerol-3-phosphate 3-phosphatidyltransferase [Eubacterial